MKNTQKGFIVPVLIAVVALLIIGGGAYVYVNKQAKISHDSSVSTQATSTTEQVSDFGYTFNVIPPNETAVGAGPDLNWKIEIKKDGNVEGNVNVQGKDAPDLFTVSPDGKFVAFRTSTFGGNCSGSATLTVVDLRNFSFVKIDSAFGQYGQIGSFVRLISNDTQITNGQNQTFVLGIKWVSNSSIEALTHYGLNHSDGVPNEQCQYTQGYITNKTFTKKIIYNIETIQRTVSSSRNYATGDFDTLYDDFNFDGLKDKIVVPDKNCPCHGYRGAYPDKYIYVQNSSGKYVLSNELTSLANSGGDFELIHTTEGENRIFVDGADSAFERSSDLYEVIPNHGLRLDVHIDEGEGPQDAINGILIPDGKYMVNTESFVFASPTSTTPIGSIKTLKYNDLVK